MTIEMKNVLELADAALSADYTRVRRAANALARISTRMVRLPLPRN